MMKPVTDLCFGAYCTLEAFNAYKNPLPPGRVSFDRLNRVNPTRLQSHIRVASVAFLCFNLINRVFLAIDSPRSISLYTVITTTILFVGVAHAQLEPLKDTSSFNKTNRKIFNISNKILLVTTACATLTLTIFGNHIHRIGVALAFLTHALFRDPKTFPIGFHELPLINILGSQTWGQKAFATTRYIAGYAIVKWNMNYRVETSGL